MSDEFGFLDGLGSADNLTATMVASVILGSGARRWYLRTLGAKRDLRRKLDTLACGNPVEYVEALFGPPAYRDSVEAVARYSRLYDEERQDKEERVDLKVYRTKYGWLTVHYIDDAVVAYAFTLTSSKFRYDVAVQSCELLRGVLGRTAIAGFDDVYPPESGELVVGASTHGYAEVRYFGRPGLYQHYGLSVSMVGWRRSGLPDWARSSVVWGRFDRDGCELSEGTSKDPRHSSVVQFRSTVEADTFAVFDQDFRYEIYDGIRASGAVDNDRLMLLMKREYHQKEGAMKRAYRKFCKVMLRL